MNKTLLFFVSFICALILVCGCAEKSIDKEDYSHNIKNRTGACADIAFKDSRTKMDEVNRLRATNQSDEADRKYKEAYQTYLQNELDYINLLGQMDNARTALNQQKNRLAAAEDHAGKTSAESLLKNATNMISACKPLEAMDYIKKAQNVLK